MLHYGNMQSPILYCYRGGLCVPYALVPKSHGPKSCIPKPSIFFLKDLCQNLTVQNLVDQNLESHIHQHKSHNIIQEHVIIAFRWRSRL